MSALLNSDPTLILNMPINSTTMHGMRGGTLTDDCSTLNNLRVNPNDGNVSISVSTGTVLIQSGGYPSPQLPQVLWSREGGANWDMAFSYRMTNIVSSFPYFIWDWNDSAGANCMYLKLHYNPYMYLRRSGSPTTVCFDTGISISDNNWHDIQIEKRGDRYRVWIDAVLVTWSSLAESSEITVQQDLYHQGSMGWCGAEFGGDNMFLDDITYTTQDMSVSATGTLTEQIKGNVRSIYFDGGDDFFTISDFYPPNGPITIAYWAWIPSASQATNMMLLSPTTATTEFRLYTNWSSTYYYFDWGGSTSGTNGGRVYWVNGMDNTYRDRWTHFAVQSQGVDGGDMRIWVDGKTIAAHNSALRNDGEYASPNADNPASLSSANYRQLYVGQYATGAYDVVGNFADLKIWARYLDPGEIKELYRRTYRE